MRSHLNPSGAFRDDHIAIVIFDRPGGFMLERDPEKLGYVSKAICFRLKTTLGAAV